MTAHDDHRRFDDLAAEWDSRPHARERADMIAAAIRDTVPLSPAMRVLEVGGGTGLLSRALVDDIGTAVVTDVSGAMVDVAGEMLADPAYAGWSARRLDIEHDDLPECSENRKMPATLSNNRFDRKPRRTTSRAL